MSTEEAALLVFQQCRSTIIGSGKFISIPELQNLLRSRFRQGMPKVVTEALHGLSQIVFEVGTQIQVIFSMQQVVTLHELEAQILANNKNFAGVASFDALKLGPLRAHHLVQRQFKPEALCSTARPPALSATDVIVHIGEWLERHWEEQPKGTKLDVSIVLQALAAKYKVASPAELGVVIRSNAFLISLLGKAINAGKRADTNAQRQLDSLLQRRAFEKRQAETDRVMQAARDASELKQRAAALRTQACTRLKHLLLDEALSETAASAIVLVALPSTLTLEQILPFSKDEALLAKAAHVMASARVDVLPVEVPPAEAIEILLAELLEADPDVNAVANALCAICSEEAKQAGVSEARAPVASEISKELEAVEAHLMASLGEVEPAEADAAGTSNDELLQWIASTCSLQPGSKPLARTVMRCILETASGSEEPPAALKITKQIELRKPLMLEYISCPLTPHTINVQAACLYEVQAYCGRKNWPQGLIKKVFYSLYETDIIFEDAYVVWREDVDDDTPGKDRALFQVNEFLQWLSDAAEEGEEKGEEK